MCIPLNIEIIMNKVLLSLLVVCLFSCGGLEKGNVLSKNVPSKRDIKTDLIGRQLSEGLTECYHTEDWRWTIAEGEISNFKIDKVVAQTDKSYEVVVSMLLSGTHHGYKTKAQVRYELLNGKWTIVKVKSLGMRAVSDSRYEDCIKCAIHNNGGVLNNGGALKITNMCDQSLAVGGKILTSNGWKTFSKVVDPLSSSMVYGSFGVADVKEGKIVFVVRPNE